MKANRSIRNDEEADVDMITTAIVAAVMFAIAVPIIFSVLGGLDIITVDNNLRTALGKPAAFKPAANATNNLVTNVNTFFTIGPIYIVVVAAVGIIAAVLMLRGRRE